MFRQPFLTTPLCAAMIFTGSLAHAQFGGTQIRIGNYGSGISVGVGSGYGSPYYGNAYGNGYYGNSYYGNSYYGNAYNRNGYYGNSYYGNPYNSYGNGIRNYSNNAYYGGNFRYRAPQYYSIPSRGVTIRRYRGR